MAFSSLPEKDFFDRSEALSLLSGRLFAATDRPVRSAILSAARGMGKTELLRQLFGHLFWKQDRIVPFLLTVNPAQLSATRFARTYLAQFLCHVFAFQKKQQALLHRAGISSDELSDLAADHGAWASDLLARYRRSENDADDALEVAVNAPSRFSLATGRPVAVLIDEFHLLQGLHADGAQHTDLSAVFREPLSSGRTPHVVTGNCPQIQEMAVANDLELISLSPMGDEGSAMLIRRGLGEPGTECPLPPFLLRRFGGNPLYLQYFAERARLRNACDETSFGEAYIEEVMDGAIASFWIAALKNHVPDLESRAHALAILHIVHGSPEPISPPQIARRLSLPVDRTIAVLKALYLAGLVRGEFGIFRPVEERVARDVLENLYQREVLAESRGSQQRSLREQLRPGQENAARYDLTIPMTRESELVAAQCIEQIGKNLHFHEDMIGQMQIAVIEACINAIEHAQGSDKTITVSILVERDRLEVSIEHAGPEFIIEETGEPLTTKGSPTAPPRGWGIKVMKRFADEVRFERTTRGTKTVLIKNLQTHSAVRKEDIPNRG